MIEAAEGGSSSLKASKPFAMRRQRVSGLCEIYWNHREFDGCSVRFPSPAPYLTMIQLALHG